MPETKEVKYLIELLAKNKGAFEAAAALSKVGDSAKGTTGKFDVLGRGADTLSGKLAAMAGAGAIVAFATESFKAFAKVERQLAATGLQMRAMGIDAEKDLPRVKAFLEAIQAAGNGVLSETVPAFQQLVGLTQDTEAAMYLTELATRMAEATGKDLASTTAVVAQVMTGKAGPALKDYGVNIRASAEGTINAKEALVALNKQFPEQAANLDDAQAKLDELASIYETVKMKTGEFVLGVIKFFQKVPEAVVGVGVTIGTALNPKNWLLGWDGFKDQLRKNIAAAFDATGVGQKAEASGAIAGEAFARGEKKAIAIAGRKSDEEQAKIDAEAAKKAVEQAAKVADLELQGEEALVAAKISMSADGSRERFDLELDALRVSHERQRAEYVKNKADTTAIDQAYEIAKDALMSEYQDKQIKAQEEVWSDEQDLLEERSEAETKAHEERIERLDAEADAAAALIQLELESNDLTLDARQKLETALIKIDTEKKRRAAKTAQEIVAIEKASGVAIVKVAKLTAMQKSDLMQRVAAAGVTFAQTAFGDSKAGAIAQAIVDTWGAANQALNSAPTPYNYILMALVIATGLANVAKIRAQNFEASGGGGGKGFDDPIHDNIARVMGGRRWAEDVVKFSGEGFEQRLKELSFARPLPEASGPDEGGVSINLYGNYYGGDSGLQDLGRDIRRATRLDRPRFSR